MRYQSIFKYKKLLFPGIIFLILIITYLILGGMLAKSWETVIQGEKINAQHIFATVIWLLAGVILNAAIDMFIWEGMIRKRTGNPVPKLLKTTASTIVFLIIIIMIVALVYNKSITGLLATTGALGLILGFALRGIIENAFQGIALNIEQIFKTGDIISIPGRFDELAEVKDVTMRNTYLQDFVGHIVAIPNSVICMNVIRNYSRPKIFSVCFSITLGVRGLSTLDAIRILHAVIASTDFVVTEPPPQVLISSVENIQVKYDIACWTQRDKITPARARHILYSNIIEQLAAAGFYVGSPALDIEDIERRATIKLHTYDQFSRLTQEEKENYYLNELTDKRANTILHQVALFSSLDDEEIKDISNRMNPRIFKSGETIIRQGESGDLMYVLVEGALQVYIKQEDKEDLIPVAKLTPGKYFGEMSLLVGDPRSATITAITDSMIFEITKETMSTLFEKHPDMIQKISEKIAEQQLINEMKKKEFSTQDANDNKRNFALALVNRITKFFWKKKE